jgi:uncharacterized protein (DUF2237 family)
MAKDSPCEVFSPYMARHVLSGKEAGNDLSTSRPEWDFPGNRWCLVCWPEALEA